MKINYKIGICADCGREKLIAHKSLKLCWLCNQVRLSKRYAERRKQKIKDGVKADKSKLNSYYKKIWDLREHRCYESGEPLFKFHKALVHHVLHKEDYPALAFNEDVSVLLTWELHSQWHSMAKSDRPRKMPKTWARYLELLKKYDPEQYTEELQNQNQYGIYSQMPPDICGGIPRSQ